jgi:hypothetical protein
LRVDHLLDEPDGLMPRIGNGSSLGDKVGSSPP